MEHAKEGKNIQVLATIVYMYSYNNGKCIIVATAYNYQPWSMVMSAFEMRKFFCARSQMMLSC